VSVRKDGENLVAEVDGAGKAWIPPHVLGSIVVFGAIYLSPPLIKACASAGITIVLLDRTGRFQARIEGPVSGNARAVPRLREAPTTSSAASSRARPPISGRFCNRCRAIM
jgi:CRISP-associated protein Cas1